MTWPLEEEEKWIKMDGDRPMWCGHRGNGESRATRCGLRKDYHLNEGKMSSGKGRRKKIGPGATCQFPANMH